MITLCEILGLVTYTLKQLCHWGYTYIESNKDPEVPEDAEDPEGPGDPAHTQGTEEEDFQCEEEPHEHKDMISNNHVNSKNSRDRKVITHFSF